jgi:hypothetical protein
MSDDMGLINVIGELSFDAPIPSGTRRLLLTRSGRVQR